VRATHVLGLVLLLLLLFGLLSSRLLLGLLGSLDLLLDLLGGSLGVGPVDVSK